VPDRFGKRCLSLRRSLWSQKHQYLPQHGCEEIETTGARKMRIDTMVHGSPRYYWWKLKALKFIKKSAGMVLGVNGQADRLREHIEKANGELIKKYLTNKSVLEVGCGTGGMLSTLEGKCRCTGVDISPAMVEYARHHNPGPDYRLWMAPICSLLTRRSMS
jgi:SAM-dependent methyltransferase